MLGALVGLQSPWRDHAPRASLSRPAFRKIAPKTPLFLRFLDGALGNGTERTLFHHGRVETEDLGSSGVDADSCAVCGHSSACASGPVGSGVEPLVATMSRISATIRGILPRDRTLAARPKMLHRRARSVAVNGSHASVRAARSALREGRSHGSSQRPATEWHR